MGSSKSDGQKYFSQWGSHLPKVLCFPHSLEILRILCLQEGPNLPSPCWSHGDFSPLCMYGRKVYVFKWQMKSLETGIYSHLKFLKNDFAASAAKCYEGSINQESLWSFNYKTNQDSTVLCMLVTICEGNMNLWLQTECKSAVLSSRPAQNIAIIRRSIICVWMSLPIQAPCLLYGITPVWSVSLILVRE